ncbi:cytochrome P450 [Streptomyces sp. NPDC087844]|uniref:cytochrome P450 family protein n=1 Tax=Streptomyces sp. NPDC087844 TaxID=3365805 RepID=UPI003801562D
MTIGHTVRGFPLDDPVLVEDPYGGSPVWIVTRYDEVSAVVTDPRFAMNTRSLAGGSDWYLEMLVTLGVSEDLAPYLAGNLVHLDPPDHTRLRRLVTRAFSARRIAALRPRVRTVTGRLVDELPGHAVDGTVDLIEHFAHPLPVTIICELLGVPEHDRPQWHVWSRDCTSTDPRVLNAMLTEMSAHMLDLIEEHQGGSSDDLTTALIHAHDEDSDRLTDTELITMVLTLMVAGHETTAHLIGNGTAALLSHPEQLALLRDNPALMPGAVQELLRLHGPATAAQLRYATEDVTLGKALIHRGDRVQAVLSSANRDPDHYARPDTLDITRTPHTSATPHLAYSRGPHYCLGATLANQEAEIALTALFTRHPRLALAVPPDQLPWKPHPLTRQLTRLPLVLGERADDSGAPTEATRPGG